MTTTSGESQVRLEQANEEFCAAFSALTPEYKAHLGQLHRAVQAEYEEATKANTPYDPTTTFTSRVMQWAHDELVRNHENKPVLAAFMGAAHLVDAYHACIKAQQS